MGIIKRNGKSYTGKVKDKFSHVGMIIHSTTLDTEDKVKAIYGGTSWIQHSGYMLRGATSGVTANDATKTGGADTVVLGLNNLPDTIWHSSAHYASGGVNTNISAGATYGIHTQNNGMNQAHNNLPSYKSVYIWERVS